MENIGKHLVIDLWNADHLDDVNTLEQILIECSNATNSSILFVKMHSFGEGQGCTGMILLAGSHVSCHTWPEYNYAAFDIFTCGNNCFPKNALPVIKEKMGGTFGSIIDMGRGFYENTE